MAVSGKPPAIKQQYLEQSADLLFHNILLESVAQPCLA